MRRATFRIDPQAKSIPVIGGKDMTELKKKVAVIYGAAGEIGGTVARAFAREGAKLFLTGHRLAPVDALAKDIVFAGGIALKQRRPS